MWILFALLGAVSAALVTVLSKAGLKNVDSSLAFAIQAVLIISVSWGVVLAQGHTAQLKDIDGRAWAYLIAAGVLTTFSSLFTFRALKLGEASVVNPLERISLVFAILLAALFLKEKITWQIIIGAALMVAGAVVIALSKTGE
jgi:bacterial/archaeal transporter family protein